MHTSSIPDHELDLMTAEEALAEVGEYWAREPLSREAALALVAEVRRLREESKLFRDASEAAELRIVELRNAMLGIKLAAFRSQKETGDIANYAMDALSASAESASPAVSRRAVEPGQ